MLPISGFSPARCQRMGMFTPLAPVAANDTDDDSNDERRQQRSDYAASMQGEEMEQHLSDVMRSNTGIASPLGAMMDENNEGDSSRLGQVAARLEATADLLARAAQMQMMLGQLRVSGVPDVAGVMSDVVGQVQAERQQTGQATGDGINHLQVGERMAQVMGIQPQEGAGSAVQRDLARFGIFVDQALRMGLSPQQTEQVVREVQSSPEGKMQPQTRELLDKQVQTSQNVSWLKARDQVDTLEHSARMLPQEIIAFGAMPVPTNANVVTVEPDVTVNPDIQVNVEAGKDNRYDDAMKKESALGGSGSVIGGNSSD
ncbi:MAG: hypothetical protein Q9P01_00835 [Anaerolineae bacterium]|nr:hypothetical protein [Anaerolineae bacterium]